MSGVENDAESAGRVDSAPVLVLLQAAAAQAGIGSFARRGLETPQAAVQRYRAAAQLTRYSRARQR